MARNISARRVIKETFPRGYRIPCRDRPRWNRGVPGRWLRAECSGRWTASNVFSWYRKADTIRTSTKSTEHKPAASPPLEPRPTGQTEDISQPATYTGIPRFAVRYDVLGYVWGAKFPYGIGSSSSTPSASPSSRYCVRSYLEGVVT